jgi:hypothetical protein
MEFYSLTISGGQDMFHLVMSILTSAVLAMLGPGAYSVDGRIFGRRLLIVPPRQRSPFLTESERLNHLARKEDRPFHSI